MLPQLESPYGDYIEAIEKACSTIEPNSAEELRSEIRGALKHTHPPRSNINREEVQALAELKRDSSKVILVSYAFYPCIAVMIDCK